MYPSGVQYILHLRISDKTYVYFSYDFSIVNGDISEEVLVKGQIVGHAYNTYLRLFEWLTLSNAW